MKAKERDAYYFDLMQRAAKSLDSAALQMRMFQLLAKEDFSELRGTIPDAAAVAETVETLLSDAAGDLFNNNGSEAGAAVGEAALNRLWACLSIVILCRNTLQAGSFGPARGNVVHYPVIHAMQSALDQLQSIRRPLDRYLANAPKTSKVKAAA